VGLLKDASAQLGQNIYGGLEIFPQGAEEQIDRALAQSVTKPPRAKTVKR
jgi:hypothetical protein